MLKLLVPFLVLFALIATAAAGYFYYQYKSLKENPNKVAEEEIKELLSAVGNLIELPEGEKPTVATVVDAKSLKNQTFFAKAQNGDKVIIYANARKAILYSPAREKIIEVGPVILGDEAVTSAKTQGLPPPAPSEQNSATSGKQSIND